MLGNSPMARWLRTAFAVATVCGVATAAPLPAPPATAPRIDSGAGGCPLAGDVEAEILRLVPPTERHRLAPPVRIRIEDEGTRYVVRVFDGTTETTRAHVDEGRNCAGRARFAAVFVVLTLMPPEVLLSLETQPSKDVEPPPAPSPSEPTSPFAEARAAGPEPKRGRRDTSRPRRSGPTAGGAMRCSWVPPIVGAFPLWIPGLELHAAWPAHREQWLVLATVGADAPRRFEIAERAVDGDVLRGDVGLGVRHQRPRDRWGPWSEAQLVGRIARWRGLGLLDSRTTWELTPGLRFGWGLGLRRSRSLTPTVGVRGAVFPLSAAIRAQPAGDVGRTPSIELGIAAGVAGWP